jgi:hypothetical protein
MKVGGEERMLSIMEKIVRLSESDYRAIMRFDDDGAYGVGVVYEVFPEALTSRPNEPENGCDTEVLTPKDYRVAPELESIK